LTNGSNRKSISLDHLDEEVLDEAVKEIERFGMQVALIFSCILYPISRGIESMLGLTDAAAIPIPLSAATFAMAGVGFGFWGGANGLAHILCNPERHES